MKILPSIFLVLLLPSLPWSKPIDANVKTVLTTGQVTFPFAMPGKEYQVQKVWDPDAKTIIFRSNSNDIPDEASMERLRQEDLRLERLKYGALSNSFRKIFDSLQDNDEIKAVVYLKYPNIRHPSKFEATQDELEAHSKSLLTLQPVVGIDEFFRSHRMQPPIHIDRRSGIYTMKKSQLKEIMFDPNVYGIEEFRTQAPLTKALSIIPSLFSQTGSFNLKDLAQSAYSHSTSNPPFNAGQGVHAATFESGLSWSFLNGCSGLSTYVSQWDANPAGTTIIDEVNGRNDSLHSLSTFWCLHNAAPGALLYHRNFHNTPTGNWYFGSDDDKNYLINNGIQTLSMSVSTPASNPNDANDFEQIAVDEFAYKYPYTVFCNPSGNNGISYIANWGSYNSINVGNIRHLNQNTWQLPGFMSCIGACSQTRNSNQRPGYGSPCIQRSDYSGCASDRELPQIVAPGISDQVSSCNVVPGTDACLKYHDGNPWYLWCGTSWSAPTVNGIAADIIAADGRFYQWPEKVRTAMYVTAENVSGYEWDGTYQGHIDGYDGAGVIDGASAVNFAKTHTSTSVGASAVTKGLAVGALDQSSFSGSKYFNILAPSTIPSGKNLRVVLTWDSNPSGITNELSDMDLRATVNGHLYYSSSWESNVEIINIASSDVTPNSTISVEVQTGANRIPNGEYIYYCVGWDWTATAP